MNAKSLVITPATAQDLDFVFLGRQKIHDLEKPHDHEYEEGKVFEHCKRAIAANQVHIARYNNSNECTI